MTTYKRHFTAPEDAALYDEQEYGHASYGTLLWQLERAVLEKLLSEFRRSHSHIGYLDFASGTGRVAAFMESRVDSSAAIEVSESMAARARDRVQVTKVICRDITAPASMVEDHYDLITAFRFFLNAEPALRLAGMRALATRLQDDSSWLVFNNHGNLWSLKLFGWPYHRLRHFRQGWKPYGNYLTHSEVKSLVHQAGLRIIKTVGLGILGGKICQPLPFEKALRLETRLASIPALQKVAQDQLYVVCRNP